MSDERSADEEAAYEITFEVLMEKIDWFRAGTSAYSMRNLARHIVDSLAEVELIAK